MRVRTRLLSFLSLAALAPLLAACAVVNHSAPAKYACGERWMILPMSNYTETPQADLRVEAIVEAVLRAKHPGIDIVRYPESLEQGGALQVSTGSQLEKARAAAEQAQAAYGLTGTVDEWRYKVGVDGEPAVGITLQVVEIKTGKVVWSAVGSTSGTSRESASGVAQKLLERLVKNAKIGC